jgi:dephospho-CoA kinase
MTTPHIIHLTGGIASGKSTAATMFESLGVDTVDADHVARDVVLPGTQGLCEIVEAFGRQVLAADGTLNRRAMREHVFSDPPARQLLEHIVHPKVRARTLELLEQASSAYALYVAPALANSARPTFARRVTVVDVKPEEQLRRVIARDGSSSAMAERIIAAQQPRDDLLGGADDIITNNSSLTDLHQQVDALHHRYLALTTAQEDALI